MGKRRVVGCKVIALVGHDMWLYVGLYVRMFCANSCYVVNKVSLIPSCERMKVGSQECEEL